MLLICYNLLNSQNVPINTMKNGWLQGDTCDVAKKASKVVQKKEP